MKKGIFLNILFLSLISLVIGISGLTLADDVVTVWSILESYENEALNDIVQEYFEKTGVKVDIVEQNQFTIKDKFMAEAPTGNGPDILMSMHTDTGTYAITGMIKPLEFDESVFNRFHDLAQGSFIYNGKNYGIGYSVESYGLVYNKDLVKKVPETWEDLFDMAEELTVRNKKGDIETYGFLIDPRNFYFTYPLFSGYGGYVFAKDEEGNFNSNDIGLDNEGSIRAMKKLKSLVDQKLIPRDIDVNVINDLFQNGQLAMMIYGPWYFNNYRENGVDFGYVGIPEVKGGKESNPFGTVLGFMLSNFADNPEESERFLKYLLQDNIQQKMIEAAEGQRIPLNNAVYNSDFVQNNEFFKKTVKVNYQAEPYPNIPEGAILWDIIPFTVDLVINGDLSAEAAMEELEQLMKENIESMRE